MNKDTKIHYPKTDYDEMLCTHPTQVECRNGAVCGKATTNLYGETLVIKHCKLKSTCPGDEIMWMLMVLTSLQTVVKLIFATDQKMYFKIEIIKMKHFNKGKRCWNHYKKL